jgi:hypothetical protein
VNAAAERLEVPEVSVSTADTVVLELEPSQAQMLAKILAHYDVIASFRGANDEQIPVVDGFDREVWQHVLVELLAQAQNARLQITAPTVIVPFRRPGAHS